MEPWLLIGEIVVCARVTIPNRMEHVKKGPEAHSHLISFLITFNIQRRCSLSIHSMCLTTRVHGKVADPRLGIRLRALRVLTHVLTKLSVSIVVMTKRSGDILPSSQGGPTPKWDN